MCHANFVACYLYLGIFDTQTTEELVYSAASACTSHHIVELLGFRYKVDKVFLRKSEWAPFFLGLLLLLAQTSPRTRLSGRWLLHAVVGDLSASRVD